MAQEKDDQKNTVLQNMFGEEALMEVNVDLSVVLGRTLLRVYQLLKLGRGAVVELNRQLNEPVEILANEIPIAKGEVIVTDEGYIGVKITELLVSQKDSGGLLVGKVGSFGK
ncbi:MAG: FliM/FliN family flagellar motor switch protein [Alphaproteobacteria bacterium]|nr:FliM/FliN family flagellar motor switch protein [Alphaproteobacteria bacterium]